MTKAVLTTKVSPVYDDLPENRYHFPKAYLNQIKKAVGDWIVYYEPRRSTGELSSSGGRQVYFATARVESIYPDPVLADHFYAEISNYLPFVRPVPFKEGVHYYETGLEKEDGSFHGAEATGIHHHGFERDHIEALAREAGFTEVRTLDGPVVQHEDRGYPMFVLVARRP